MELCPILHIISGSRTIYKLFVSIFLILTLSGCLEKYDLFPDGNPQRIVVEGLVTNKKGPYYIRLTLSNTDSFIGPFSPSPVDSAEAVTDAIVIISDNVNQVDTLAPINVNIDDYKYDFRLGYYKFIFDSFGNIIDTIFLEDPREFRLDRGFYKTRKLIGIPGRTYYLKIILNGKEYNANCHMPDVPDLDSVGYEMKYWKDGAEYYIPLIYFSEPQNIENYYLIQLVDEITSRSISANYYWRFSVLSDEFLPQYVNGINVSLGANPRSFDDPSYYQIGDSIYVALSSLSVEGYRYYKSLLEQFKNDGGAYKQSPASPPTNIDNGGLGFFRASAISEKKVKIQ